MVFTCHPTLYYEMMFKIAIHTFYRKVTLWMKLPILFGKYLHAVLRLFRVLNDTRSIKLIYLINNGNSAVKLLYFVLK